MQLGAVRRAHSVGGRSFVLLLLTTALAVSMLVAPVAAVARNLDTIWPGYSDDVVYGGVWSRDAVASHIGIFRPYGMNMNYAYYSDVVTIQGTDMRRWAGLNPNPIPSRSYKLGNYWFTPVTYSLAYSSDWFSAWSYGTSFIARVCGNFTPWFNNPSPPVVSGIKWNDVNGNGQRDAGEPGVAGWTIRLYRDGSQRATTTTDGNGYYQFVLDAEAGHRPGWYEVREDSSNDWIATYGGSRAVNVLEGSYSAGRNYGNNNFGNFKLGKLSGTKWIDMDGDGVRDPEDVGAPGWEFQLRQGSTVVATAVTGPDGRYTFAGVRAGAYEVHEVGKAGWAQTYPIDTGITWHGAVVSSGTDRSGLDFGNTQAGAIQPLKVNDLDRDGLWDDNEPLLAGWVFHLNSLEGSLEGTAPTDPIVTTADAETTRWWDLLPGTYLPWEEMQDGWVPTGEPTQTVVLQSGQRVSVPFFNAVAYGTVRGAKYHDLNGDGERQEGEPGIAGWSIRLDGPDGVQHMTTDADGVFAFDSLLAGHYTVSEEGREHWVQTTGTSGDVDLAAGQVFDISFGNRLTGDIVGRKFEDKNGNGELDSGEPPVAGVEISLLTQGGALVGVPTTTDAEGRYEFSQVPPGEYSVVESLDSGWRPSDGATRVVEVVGGVVIEPKPLLNVELCSISGVKYDDSNVDGVRGDGEVVVPGWGVALQKYSADEWSTVATASTDADGRYAFTELWPGTYRTVEETRSAWLQVAAPDPQLLASGDQVENADFGNVRLGSLTLLKWDDSNANGVREVGETSLPGWKFALSGAPAGSGTFSMEATTRPDGTWSLTDALPGPYSAEESAIDLQLNPDGTVVEPGWRPTTSAAQSKNLAEGENALLQFGNLHLGWIWGRATHEVFGTPVAGMTITLEETGQQATTNADGYYFFYRVEPNETSATPTPDYLVGMELSGTTWCTHDAVDKAVVVKEGDDGRADFTVYGQHEALGNTPRTIGYWKNWDNHYTAAEMTALVQKVREGSSEFASLQVADVYPVLQLDRKTDMRGKARAQALAMWLNIASGNLGFDTIVHVGAIKGWQPVFTEADAGGHMTVLQLARQVDEYFTSGTWSKDVWEVIKNVMDALNNGLVS